MNISEHRICWTPNFWAKMKKMNLYNLPEIYQAKYRFWN
jgi:hypothetical protein